MSKLTINQIQTLIAEDGLPTAVYESKRLKIADSNLDELFEKARELFVEIEEYMEDNMFEDDVEEPSEDEDDSYDDDYN